MDLFASCAPGVEELLRDEIRALGVPEAIVQPGGVEFRGDQELLYRANLELGLAIHVLIRVGVVRARHFGELVRKVSRLNWQAFIAPGQPLRIHVTSRRSKLFHTGAIEERVKLAIGEALKQGTSQTSLGHPVPLHVRLFDDEATLSLDSSGEPLHRRGYRLATAKAPLRPDLARALVVLSGWDRMGTFIDPMAGSGTIGIEAAFLASAKAPGIGRTFSMMDFQSFDSELWSAVLERCHEREKREVPVRIICRDRNEGAARAIRENAERAGVLSLLDIAPSAISRLLDENFGGNGALVTNPPHGNRVGKRGALLPLYQTLGKLVQRLPRDWGLALIVNDRRLAHATGVPLKTALLTNSGGTQMRVMIRAHEEVACYK